MGTIYRPVPAWVLALVWLASTGVLLGLNVAYTNQAIKKAERARCEGIAVELAFYTEKPPDTDRAVARRDYYERQWRSLCA